MSEKGTSRKNWFTSCRVSSSHFSMHVRFLLIDGGAYYLSSKWWNKKERCFFNIIPKKHENLQEKLASSFQDIWNNGFSILDPKKVQKFIKVNQICSYLCKTCTNTTHRAQTERGRLHKKNSNNLVPRTFPIPLHAPGSWLNFKLFRNHS